MRKPSFAIESERCSEDSVADSTSNRLSFSLMHEPLQESAGRKDCRLATEFATVFEANTDDTEAGCG